MRPARRSAVLVLVAVCALSFGGAGAAAQTLPDWAVPSGTTPGPGPGMPQRIDQVSPPGPPGPPPNPTPIPVDGGLALLGLAGTAFLGRRLRRRAA